MTVKQSISDSVLSQLLNAKDNVQLHQNPLDARSESYFSDDNHCISRALYEYPKMALKYKGTDIGKSYIRSVKLTRLLAIACKHRNLFYKHRQKSVRRLQQGRIRLVEHENNLSRLLRRRIITSETIRNMRLKLKNEIELRKEMRKVQKRKHQLH